MGSERDDERRQVKRDHDAGVRNDQFEVPTLDGDDLELPKEIDFEVGLAEEAPSSAATSDAVSFSPSSPGPATSWERCLGVLNWTPKNCRYDPENPPRFTKTLNFVFAIVSHPCLTPIPVNAC